MAAAKTKAAEGKKSVKTKDESENTGAAKAQALDATLTEIGKRYGTESIMRMGAGYQVACDAIPSGSLALDAAIGIGGIPKGRIVEFYGPESSGKTTLALMCTANSQAAGGTAAFIDAEHALDPLYARTLGVDLDNLLVSQPDSGEQALEICELLVRSNAVDVIVIDSVAALTPQAELDGEMGQSHVGLQARLMSQGLRKLTGLVKKSNCTVIFINQIRMKIGISYGSPETTTGGNALKFYASLRLDIRRGQPVKRGEETIGNEIKVKVVKNKVSAPFRTAHFELLYSKGVNRMGELVELGVEHNILGKAGNWLSYGETRIGNGRDKAIEFLLANPDMTTSLEAELRAVLSAQAPGADPGPKGGDGDGADRDEDAAEDAA